MAVLDVSMPNMDGFEVLAAIRQAALPVKVIMLTARQHERDVLRGFAMGADDYVVKPFSPLANHRPGRSSRKIPPSRSAEVRASTLRTCAASHEPNRSPMPSLS